MELRDGGFELDDTDRRLVAALQIDGLARPETLAGALALAPAAVRRRLGRLFDAGACRVRAVPERPAGTEITLLRVRVRPGRADQLARALAAQTDVRLIDVSRSGDEVSAAILSGPGRRSRLVLEQLPATSAVASLTAQTVLHVYAEAHAWRFDVLTDAERLALGGAHQRRPDDGARPPAVVRADPLEARLLALLAQDARQPAAALARELDEPESTVRRRLASLREGGGLRTEVTVDPARLGLAVDADLWMRVPPADLDRIGEALAAHPAVHGAAATTGETNLQAAVWLATLEDLHLFVARDLAELGVPSAEIVLNGPPVKR